MKAFLFALLILLGTVGAVGQSLWYVNGTRAVTDTVDFHALHSDSVWVDTLQVPHAVIVSNDTTAGYLKVAFNGSATYDLLKPGDSYTYYLQAGYVRLSAWSVAVRYRVRVLRLVQ